MPDDTDVLRRQTTQDSYAGPLLTPAGQDATRLRQTLTNETLSSRGAYSAHRDPFRDPSFDLSRSSSLAAGAHANKTTTTTSAALLNQHYPYASNDLVREVRGLEESESRSSFERPSIDKRPSEIAGDLEEAMSESSSLPPPIRAERPESGPRRAHVPPRADDGYSDDGRGSSSRRRSGGGGFIAQLRSGQGWFGPLVPPEPKKTREEREQENAERVAKLREGKAAPKKARPSLLKRASSGVEMMVSSMSSSGSRARSNSTFSKSDRIAEQ